MAKATAASKSKKPKIDPQLVARIVEELNRAEGDDPTRLWRTAHALGNRDPEVAKAALAKSEQGGVARHWLAVIAGASGPAEARALGELATTATSARVLLAQTMPLVAAQLDEESVARAAENLAIGAPFSPFVLDQGRRAALVTGRAELARVLDARHAFVERHAGLLADLAEDAQEKKQKAAIASLQGMTGADRDQLLLWLLDRADLASDAKQWARVEAIANPAVPVLHVAAALNQEYGIYDKEEAELGARLVEAGEVGLERGTAILEEAVGRTWVSTIEHLSEAFPAAFATPRGFAAVMRGLGDRSYVMNRLCEDARRWAKKLDADQAAQVAETLIELNETLDDRPAGLGRAFFYFENPGGLAAFAAALEREVSASTRDELYDAIQNIATTEAQDVLIGRLWAERENLRDLVFSFNKACMPHRHADVMARLDREPAFDAAWLYVGCHVTWAHRPRWVLEVLERVFAWSPDGDPARRAFVFSQGVKAAIELRRYDIARRALEALGETKKAMCPATGAVDTVLGDKQLAKQLAALRSGKLEEQQRALLAKVERLRAAGTPIEADDERLGMLAGGKVLLRVHVDRKSHEVWFFDAEGTFFYYDGFGIAAPPFELQIFVPVNGWDPEAPGLGAFCRGWRLDGRSLHVSDVDKRQVLRSGARLLVRYHGDRQPLTTWRAFAFTFRDEAAATRAFEALDRYPADGFRSVDPFYIGGKRGGAWVRHYGARSASGYCVDTTVRVGGEDASEQTFSSSDEAREAFDRAEGALLERGLWQSKLELDDTLRPQSDKPLLQFLDNRYRDDNKDAIWHLEALPAIRAALAGCQLPLADIEIAIGPPASESDLAAYDASLPEPMPEALRALWRFAGSASWRVGEQSQQLLGPAVVVANRAAMRAELAKRVATLRQKRQRDEWSIEHLDILVRNGDGEGEIVWDTRQEREDGFDNTATDQLAHPWRGALSYVLSEAFVASFVDALKEKFPEIKKLKLGQPVSELKAAKKKPAAKKTRQ